MKRVPGFSTAGDVAQAPANAGNTAPAPASRAERRRKRPPFKHALSALTSTALLAFEQFAYHAAQRWVEDDQAARRHTRLFHDFSATATAAKLDRSRQWTSHSFGELEAVRVFNQRPQRRNPATGQFDETRPKLIGDCSQFWQLVKAKYAYLCIQAGLPIRNKKGKVIYQDPKQTVAAQRAPRPARPAPARAAPDPTLAEQWAAMTEAQRRLALQFTLPGFTPPG